MTHRVRPRSAGFTLVEILIAVNLLGLLSVGMLIAIRVALNGETKANARLTSNRRVVGAQQALLGELNGFMPEVALWRTEAGMRKFPFFEGTPQSMRFVSSYSLDNGNRSLPQLLEFFVLPGDNGVGVRLLVNELPYRGGASAGSRIAGFEADSGGAQHPVFFPIAAGAGSFVLADRLAYCHMLYLAPEQNPPRREWTEVWAGRGWPLAVRVEMAPLDASGATLHPITVTVPLRAFRDPDKTYGDEPGLK